MTRDELLATLRTIAARGGEDREADHGDADNALLNFIDDPDVTEAWLAIEKWFA